MPAETIGDLFDAAAEFEKRLVQFYADLRDKSEDNNIRLLAYYLSRHRKHLSEVMDTCDPALAAEIRSTILEDSVSFHPYKDFYIIGKPIKEIEGSELIDAAIHYDSSLLTLYKMILDIPIFEKAKGKFESLIKTEKRDISLLRRMKEMHYF